jgi:D-3-phosphoglycerate dehydrogenase
VPGDGVRFRDSATGAGRHGLPVEALTHGRIAAAGLDVFAKEPPDQDNPLLQMDNVVVTPHNGGGTVDTMKRIVGHAFANILRVERGEPLPAADRVKGT